MSGMYEECEVFVVCDVRCVLCVRSIVVCVVCEKCVFCVICGMWRNVCYM